MPSRHLYFYLISSQNKYIHCRQHNNYARDRFINITH